MPSRDRIVATQPRRVVALGGVGGDAHSVGLTILRHALTASGLDVLYVGPQSPLEMFFEIERECNAVLISSLDGLAQYYLQRFRHLRERYPHPSWRPPWYLGGQLGVADQKRCVREFRQLGFARVFPSFTPLSEVLADLEADLDAASPIDVVRHDVRTTRSRAATNPQAVSDHRLVDAEFDRARREVLAQWPTGAQAADLDQNAKCLSRRPMASELQRKVRSSHALPIIQPRCGVAAPGAQLELFQSLRRHGAGLLSFQIDSLTRNNEYRTVSDVLRDSARGHRLADLSGSPLNGYPLVNHGVATLRRIVSKVDVPTQIRHSTKDPRLLCELSYAGGVSAFEGGCISYNIPYYRNYPLGEAIANWQYVDRLTGTYADRFGIVLDREFFGTLTAVLVPPSLALAVDVLEAVLAAQQGVRSVSLGYAEQGNRVQDIAACRVLPMLARDVLRNLGHREVEISVVLHQYMGAFPTDRQRAGVLIRSSAVTARLCRPTRLLTKTPAEATGLPTLGDNLLGLDLVRQGLSAPDVKVANEERITQEVDAIRAEAEALIEGVIHAGHGSIVLGITRAFERGLLDIPFSPSIHNRGEVVPARDADGAVRYASFGRLPFGRDIREFNDDRLASRRRTRPSGTAIYGMLEEDVMQVPLGRYDMWPLDAARWLG